MNNPVVRFVASMVLALTWVIAWQQILYASELPGEGFTASILMLLAMLLQFVVLGYHEASERFPPVWFFRAFVAGVAVLAGLMIGPMLVGQPLLTVFKLQLGAYVLSSTTIFDVAMFLAVSGAMLAAFTQMKEPMP
ncbi:MAG: MnhB domain-containing protein [Candidatus Sericytochromatia bacterium]